MMTLPGKTSVAGAVPALLYVIICTVTAFEPANRVTWLVENITVWIFLAAAAYIHFFKYRFSLLSIWVIFAASIVHTIGAHYTFQGMPWGEYFAIWGQEGRNNFDRFGHFICGVVAFPLLEYFFGAKLIRRYSAAAFFAVMVMIGVGAVYEIIEWIYSEVTTEMLGESYLGTQGDPWDAQADMMNCLAGAVAAVVLYGTVHFKSLKKSKTMLN